MSVSHMESSLLWLVIGFIGLTIFAFRMSFFWIFGSIDDIPTWFEKPLRFVPPAVFAAFVAPTVVAPGGTVTLSLSNAHFVSGIVAGVVAWRTESLHLTILVGMVVFGLTQISVA